MGNNIEISARGPVQLEVVAEVKHAHPPKRLERCDQSHSCEDFTAVEPEQLRKPLGYAHLEQAQALIRPQPEPAVEFPRAVSPWRVRDQEPNLKVKLKGRRRQTKRQVVRRKPKGRARKKRPRENAKVKERANKAVE